MSFSDDVLAAKSADIPHEDVPILVNGHAYTLRFRQMNGYAWSLAVDRHPMLPDSAASGSVGYDIRGVAREVAPETGVLFVDGKETPLRVDPFDEDMTDEQKAARVDEWATLLTAMNGRDFRDVCDAIWRLNDATPARELAAAVEQVKKARRPKSTGSGSQPDSV